MIEVHIVAEDESDDRIVVGPAAPDQTDGVCTLRIESGGEEVFTWALGPESARMLVEEIRRRAGAGGRFL